MSELILHIPHSSSLIPLKDGFVIDDVDLEAELYKLTEWNINALFYSQEDIMITADFSRIFCDAESIFDQTRKNMNQSSASIFHETTKDGKSLRVLTPELKEKILNEYYMPHHLRLTEAIEKQLSVFSKAIIIDCHSFPDESLSRGYDKIETLPDICIGTDPFHTSKALIDITYKFFKDNDLNVTINTPFFGTIIPIPFYQKDKRVQSIKINVNKKLYGGDNSSLDLDFLFEIKSIIDDYLDLVRNA